MNNVNKDRNISPSKSCLKLVPMPEIAYLDPITGELPKNVHELIKAKCEGKSANKSKTGKQKNEDFDLKLERMPEIYLIDPVTGKLPKNYKDLLAQRKSTLPKPETESSICSSSLVNSVSTGKESKAKQSHKRKSNNEFDISNVGTKKARLSKSGCTNYESKSVRKALFKNTNTGEESSILQKQRTRSTDIDESVLLDIEESEKQMFVEKKKLKGIPTNVIKSRITPLQKKSNSRKESSSSHSSLEEFLKLEQLTKTPKSIINQKTKNDCNILSQINNIMIKFNENQKLYERLETNNKEINDNLNKILDSIKNTKNHNDSSGGNENASPNCAATKNSLRIATLRKNFGKKVIFDLGESGHSDNEIEDPGTILKTIATQTPNTVMRNVRRKAESQLLKLQDTPKPTFKPNRFV